MAQLLFPLGVRLSTWIGAACFVVVAVRRRDQRPLLAAAAWLTGFEAVFEFLLLALGVTHVGSGAPLFPIIVCTFSIVWLTRQGILPDWRFLGAAVAVLSIWAAFGLHANGHQHGIFALTTSMRGFSWRDEALNEVSKTLWAAAYLIPLLRKRTRRERVAKLQGSSGVAGNPLG